jgi:hypothetical protein
MVLMCCSMLSCFPTTVLTTPESIEPDWLDKTTSIVPGKTNRTSVRNLLGDPFISSNYWNLDIFRQSAKQHEVDLVLIIPAFYGYSTFYRYTLVTYDENDIVNGIKTGLVRADPYWRLLGDETKDWSHYEYVELHSGHFTLLYVPEFGETLFVDSLRTANYLQSLRPLTDCLAVVREDSAYGDLSYSVTSDNGERQVVRAMRPERLATLMLSSGPYTIVVSEKGVLGQESKSITCERGDIVYIDIHRVTYQRQGFWKAVVTLKDAAATFRIDLYDEMPDAFVGLSQIIMSEGKWIVNPAQGSYSPETLFTDASQKKNPSQSSVH